MPHGEISRSPSQPVVFESGPYAKDWLYGEVNHPGLYRVNLDLQASGRYQGAVFAFSKGLANYAVNRMAFGPDGHLYIGTYLEKSGNWPAGNLSPMYRLEYSGIESVRVHKP